ncbi:dihydroxyacetone kinase subunit DhaK [Vibrio mediterranei]|uniref:Dihydroxyacetone kinase subunit DhaK n=1 Tax=Vibrio mediterranei TaxID=689 RepID=A0A3G4VI96_9VIBR|nr:dihydroxyacetone kinase subunit DhaK [Vibrio mediterranei]AYV23332.1 dihydroxyacetone kinase subunit DhaK [Vibrio mediterranei]
MKQLINDVEQVVLDQVAGLTASRPEIKVNESPLYVWHDLSPNQVALVSGGASGHEPMHVGFVGKGMVTGACPGEIFTRATPDQIYECASRVSTDKGVLFLIKNYTGDVLNFKLAVELLQADGIKVGSVLIDDDIAVQNSLYTTGRRGGAGTVLLEKIVGAAAERGYSLEQCETLGRRVINNCRTLGIALNAPIVPEADNPCFELADNEVEFGVGIHGEPGMRRIEYTNANELVSQMFTTLVQDPPYSRFINVWDREESHWNETEFTTEQFEPGHDYIVIVNGFGGTPVSQLYVAYQQLAKCCQQENFNIVRNMVGSYCTALDMEGLSITLLNADKEMIELFDAPVDTPALRW